MMRTKRWTALALTAGLLSGTLVALADDKDDEKDKAAPKGEEIAWAKTFAAAKDQAKDDHKMIMIDFYTDWCGWCKKLDADTYSNGDVIKLSRQLVPVKLDAEDKGEGQKAAEAYKVRGYPTILFLDPADLDSKDGGVVGKIGGYLPPQPFARQVRQIAEGFQEFPKLKERLKDSPDDVPTLAKLVVAYHMRGDDDKAAELLERAERLDPKNADDRLTAAYNAVADSYQENQQFDKAIPLFRKAAETGKQVDDVSYARTSLAVCLLSQGKFADAVPELEAAVKLDGISAGDKEQAERLLRVAKQMAEQKAKKEKDKEDDSKAEP